MCSTHMRFRHFLFLSLMQLLVRDAALGIT
jgi:hypothetical protein